MWIGCDLGASNDVQEVGGKEANSFDDGVDMKRTGPLENTCWVVPWVPSSL
jgi:hypothetical protein